MVGLVISEMLKHENDFSVSVGQAYISSHLLGMQCLDYQPRVTEDNQLLNVHLSSLVQPLPQRKVLRLVVGGVP